MKKEHKEFIRKKLIPFILREQGRGFMMEQWLGLYQPGETIVYLEMVRSFPAPKCGTVCCIGGSIAVLKKERDPKDVKLSLGESIGLNSQESRGLFFEWEVDSQKDYRWPSTFARKYAARKTEFGRAKVAVELLREVIRTDGKCLHQSK